MGRKEGRSGHYIWEEKDQLGGQKREGLRTVYFIQSTRACDDVPPVPGSLHASLKTLQKEESTCKKRRH